MTGKKKNSGINTGDNSVVIGGNVESSNIVIGNNNTVSNQTYNLSPLFDKIEQAVDAQKSLSPTEKEDVKAEVQEIKTALEEQQPDETFLARRFRNLQRMAPEIVEVALKTLANPAGGVVEVISRIAKKMAEDAK